jgi:hypothetical protein
LVPHYAL